MNNIRKSHYNKFIKKTSTNVLLTLKHRSTNQWECCEYLIVLLPP